MSLTVDEKVKALEAKLVKTLKKYPVRYGYNYRTDRWYVRLWLFLKLHRFWSPSFLFWPMTPSCCENMPGWYGIIADCIEELAKSGWGKYQEDLIAQVKEKYGGLRFYVGAATHEQYDLIGKYEELSFKVCEVCGDPGKFGNKGHWFSTRCDACPR